MTSIVSLIVDDQTGLRTVEEALHISDVWLVESENNRRVSAAIWSHSDNFQNLLSTFQVSLELSTEEKLLVALELIDSHHNQYTDKGDWGELRVIGLSLSQLSESFLSENQLRVKVDQPDEPQPDVFVLEQTD